MMVMRDLLKKFLVENYRHDRLYGRGNEYGDAVVDGRVSDLQQAGVDCISRFESRTGDEIYYIHENGCIKTVTDERRIRRLLGLADVPRGRAKARHLP